MHSSSGVHVATCRCAVDRKRVSEKLKMVMAKDKQGLGGLRVGSLHIIAQYALYHGASF